MKLLKLTIYVSMLFVSTLCYAQLSFGDAQKFNDDWLFALEDDARGSSSELDDNKWRKLTLPHDWSVEQHMSPTLASCQGYLPGGVGWYRKRFNIDDPSKRYYIYFEGVYNRSEVYLNGELLGKRPSGYISFAYDMTNKLNFYGENVLAVKVDHSREADSRWYTGSGIYRDVWLVEANNTHFAQWGIGYEALRFKGDNVDVKVDYQVVSHTDNISNLYVVNELRDADSVVVARSKRPVRDLSKQSAVLTVKGVKRWSLGSPYMYELSTKLYEDGKQIDEAKTRVGLRSIEFDADRGFALNGEWMKIKGVCLHHDAGVLGAVVPKDVWRRRLENLKAIGVNAIRMSHNPQAPVVYDLCDELGLLVMDEAFDEWEFPKRKWIEGWNVGTPGFEGTFDYFEQWCERDVVDMVRRDRNHPSIFMWSIGNEVDYPNDPYSHPVLDGGEGSGFSQPAYGGYDKDAPDAMRIGVIAERLAKCVKSIDTSRPTTGALAGVVMSNQTAYPQVVDVVGYNYTESRYEVDHKNYPDRVIYGSENRSDYKAWTHVRDKEYIFGQFIWTGTDYMGESGRWPSRGLGTGLLDFASFVKPRGAFRASLWSDNPTVYIGTYLKSDKLSIDAPAKWNYAQGDTIRVVCYTNSPQARLLLNGDIVGHSKPYDMQTGIIYWDIPFMAGTLTAQGCSVAGNVESEYTIVTSSRPYALRASIDKEHISSTEEVAHIVVEVVDESGNLVTLADNMIHCHIEGSGVLLGLENGSNRETTHSKNRARRVHNGRLLAYISAKQGAEQIRVRFESALLEGCEVIICAEQVD